MINQNKKWWKIEKVNLYALLRYTLVPMITLTATNIQIANTQANVCTSSKHVCVWFARACVLFVPFAALVVIVVCIVFGISCRILFTAHIVCTVIAINVYVTLHKFTKKLMSQKKVCVAEDVPVAERIHLFIFISYLKMKLT